MPKRPLGADRQRMQVAGVPCGRAFACLGIAGREGLSSCLQPNPTRVARCQCTFWARSMAETAVLSCALLQSICPTRAACGHTTPFEPRYF